MTTVFWISAILLFHTYFGYAVSVWLISHLRKRSGISQHAPEYKPRIAFIIPAYNEAAVIGEKCRNTLALDYPSDLVDIIVVTDGSTDETAQLASQCAGVRVLHTAVRAGKAAALNRAVAAAGDAEVLVFSDANSMLSKDALQRMMHHYADPATGGVSGEKRVDLVAGHPVNGEGIYWQYESAMKRLDADFFSLIAAAGELFSIRKKLWQPIPEDTILDDLHLTLSVCLQGWRFRYEPRAVATEPPSPSLADERERKIRIAAGAFQILFRFRTLWWPFGHFRLWYIFISRRVFRWVVAPCCLILMLMSNLWIMADAGSCHPIYQLACWAQLLGYASATVGWGLIRTQRHAPWIFQVCFYLVFMHLSMFLGLARFLSGKQTSVWRKSPRY
jgi:cellulose synthase/poly-beta-1,6-N-acetylglucosamine synthase-like glycosyltransferase